MRGGEEGKKREKRLNSPGKVGSLLRDIGSSVSTSPNCPTESRQYPAFLGLIHPTALFPRRPFCRDVLVVRASLVGPEHQTKAGVQAETYIHPLTARRAKRVDLSDQERFKELHITKLKDILPWRVSSGNLLRPKETPGLTNIKEVI